MKKDPTLETNHKILLAEIEDRLVRWLVAAETLRDIYFDPVPESWTDDQTEEYHKQKEQKIRIKYGIPYGVCLFPLECADMRDKDLFMKFAKIWLKGEMDDEAFEFFTFHFAEIVEIDFFWVLMDQPAFYYKNIWKDYNGEPDYYDLMPDLYKIGTRSKKKKKINFNVNIGHDS